MATPSKVHLTPDDTGVFKFTVQNAETAARASELLQENHDKHHIFFNVDGFHNHIVHHILSLYALGAPKHVIEKQYQDNASYQRPPFPIEERVIADMDNPEHFQKYLGDEKYYHDFLLFWQHEMEKKGWENVLNEYVFAGDERADDLLCRLYAGFLHPLIHLGFGIEFRQPAIIAEALAQAAVHTNWITPYLLQTEAASTAASFKTLPQLIDEIQLDKTLVDSVHWEDGNKIRDGILKRAPEEMTSYAKQWTVYPGELEKKTMEMVNTSVWFTAAAQHPPKQVKIDFFYMHCVNSSIFFPTFNAQPWLSEANKVRLLKFKGYIDLAMYVSRGCPPLLEDEIQTYVSAKTPSSAWRDIFQRMFEHEDDGHAIKLVRAVAFGEAAGRKYEGEDWAKVKGTMWGKIGSMIADSVEDAKPETSSWARNVGFDDAWDDFEDRPLPAHL